MEKRTFILVGRSYNHSGFYTFLLNLFNEYKINFYTNFEIYNRLKEKLPTNINIFPTSKRVLKFGRVKNAMIIIDDPADVYNYLYLWYKSLRGESILLCIHDLNKWIIPSQSMHEKNRFYGIIPKIYRKIVFQKIDKYLVFSEKIVKYGLTLRPDKKFIFVPFGFSKCNKEVNNISLPLKLAMPGRINASRNYETIIRAIEKSDLIKKYIQLIFLGTPTDEYGKSIMNKLQNLKKEGFNIVLFNEWISATEYIKKHRVHMLISTFDPNYLMSDGYKEIYGKTKETAIVSMSLEFGLPIILPIEYNYPNEMNGQVLQIKNSNDLTTQLERIINDNSILNALSEKAVHNNHSINQQQILKSIVELF